MSSNTCIPNVFMNQRIVVRAGAHPINVQRTHVIVRSDRYKTLYIYRALNDQRVDLIFLQ